MYFKNRNDDIAALAREVTFDKNGTPKSFAMTDTLPRESIHGYVFELAKRKRSSSSPPYSATIFKVGSVAIIKKTAWVVAEFKGTRRWQKL